MVLLLKNYKWLLVTVFCFTLNSAHAFSDTGSRRVYLGDSFEKACQNAKRSGILVRSVRGSSYYMYQNFTDIGAGMYIDCYFVHPKDKRLHDKRTRLFIAGNYIEYCE